MYSYSGSCQCQEVRFSLALPKALCTYSPRKCDCDFCMQRDIRYLSDPQGLLEISTTTDLLMQKQGSEQASFITCSQCQDVIAATIESNQGLIGAVNGKLMHEAEQLQPPSVVSPKKLSAQGKAARWLTVWQPVNIAQGKK